MELEQPMLTNLFQKPTQFHRLPFNRANELLLLLESVLQGTERRAGARQLTGGGVSKDEKGRRDTSASWRRPGRRYLVWWQITFDL